MVNKSLKLAGLLVMLFAFKIANGQTNNDWQLKLGANYAHGFLTENSQTMQLHVNVGFEKNNFEARLDGFYYLGQQGDRDRFSINHQAFLGGYYYFLKNSVRPYVGAQIGMAMAQSTEYGIFDLEDNLEFETAINPVVSIGAGLDYKLNDRIDFNIECRQIFGKHMANSHSTYLDEFRVSLGVGFILINKSTN